MEEDLRKLTKSNNRKKALIVILIFTLLLAGIVIFVLLYQKDKEEPKKVEPKQEEKQEETKQEEPEEEQEDYGKVVFNGKEYTIRIDEDLNGYPVTYLNDKRIDGIGASRAKAMNGYLILIDDGGQFGSDFVFLDNNLDLLPIDVKYVYTAASSNDYGPTFDFSNNKVKAGFMSKNHLPGTSADFSVYNLYVYKNDEHKACSEDNMKNPSEYKETIEKYKNDIVNGTIEFSYANHKISYTYIDKKTVWDLLGNDVINNTNTYCVERETD